MLKSLWGALLAGLMLSSGPALAADSPLDAPKNESLRSRLLRTVSLRQLQVPAAPVPGYGLEPMPQYGAPSYSAPDYASPMPAPGYPMPSFDPGFGPGPLGLSGSSALFHNVRYEDKRNIHPCAVPKIVQVPDPCADPCACGPQCVNVLICVPPCECVEVSVSRKGDRVKYDYGKYTVQITSRRGAVVVDYDD